MFVNECDNSTVKCDDNPANFEKFMGNGLWLGLGMISSKIDFSKYGENPRRTEVAPNLVNFGIRKEM